MTQINGIPLSRCVICMYCRTTIDSNGNGTWQRGTGWFPQRKSARGSHSATMVKREAEYACSECIDKLKLGIPAGQMRLWDNQ